MRPSEPPLTVKSWLKAATTRPSTMPVPVTTPSPGKAFVFHAEIVAIVLGVQAPFLEGAGLEELVEAVARGHHALFAAGVQFVLAAARAGGGAAFFEFVECCFGNSHKVFG